MTTNEFSGTSAAPQNGASEPNHDHSPRVTFFDICFCLRGSIIPVIYVRMIVIAAISCSAVVLMRRAPTAIGAMSDHARDDCSSSRSRVAAAPPNLYAPCYGNDPNGPDDPPSAGPAALMAPNDTRLRLRSAMNLELDNATALVTGSTGGIGMEIARSLAREGARVMVNGRTEANVAQAIADIRATVPDAKLGGLAADNGTAAGCATTIAKLPSVDILVNNLGIYEAVGFFDETDEAWQRLFEVNIMSGVRLSRHYLKDMLKRGRGRIIFISSESALSPAPEMAHYSATKTMQLSISRSLAELTKGTAVTVNTVLPGSTVTDSVKKFVADVFPTLPQEEAEKRFIKENRSTSLIGRFIRPEEIGDAVAFVASPKASAINGAAIRVDGGIVKSIV